MKKIAQLNGSQIYFQSPTDSLQAWLINARRQLVTPILVYHAVLPHEAAQNSMQHLHNVPPDVFRQHLLQLQRLFTVVLVDEIVERIKQNKSVTGLAAITFDDGYCSVLSHAAPILQHLSMPATFFITAKLVGDGQFWRDKVRYLINHNLVKDFIEFANESQVADFAYLPDNSQAFYRQTKNPSRINSRDLEALLDDFLHKQSLPSAAFPSVDYCTPADLSSAQYSNITFGNHGYGHHILSSLSSKQQEEEIVLGEKFLRDLGLTVSNVFSVPFGGKDTVNATTLQILHDYGYKGVAMSNVRGVMGYVHHGLGFVSRIMPQNTPLSLLRVWLGGIIYG